MMGCKVKTCDVLIVGGGPAAMRAAIESAKFGVRVVLVAKGKLGKSGNAVISRTTHSAPFGHLDARDTTQEFFVDIMTSGCMINNYKLAEILANEACKRIKDLEKLGVEFSKKRGKFVQVPSPGHSYRRGCRCIRGRGTNLTLPLRNAVINYGVEVFEKTMIIKLIRSPFRVVGAIGLDIRTRQMIAFQSKTTVLATGGAGRVYGITDNAIDETGDGYSMAFDVGAELVDMEFFQFYPACLIHPFKCVIAPSLFKVGARLLNSEGESFMKNYDQNRVDEATRDIRSIATFQEVRRGRGVDGGAKLDLSNVSKKNIRILAPDFYEPLTRRGLDYERLVVSPAAHFFMGGIKINQRCETNVCGLYAAGEVTGGVHGANRLADNALTETQVFGRRAGLYSAMKALETEFIDIDEADIKGQLRQLEGSGAGFVLPCIDKLRRKMRETMWECVGVLREKEGLNEALALFDEIEEELSHVEKAWEPGKLIEAIELMNMLVVSKLIARAALIREESRGAHFRTDYPQRNDRKWLKNILITKGIGNRPKISLVKTLTPDIYESAKS